MNCVSNLAKKNLTSNKTKNILVILSIALSTCLMLTIGIFGYSMQQMNIDNATTRYGDFHGRYSGVNEKQLEVLKNNRKIERVGESIQFATIESKTSSDAEISLIYVDSNAANMTNIFIDKGHLPSKSADIVMERWLLDKLNIKPELGQAVHTEYGDFTLSGILKDKKFNKEDHSYSQAVVSKEFILNHMRNPEEVSYIRIKKGNNIQSTVKEIGNKIGRNAEEIRMNSEYVKSLEIDPGIITIVLIVGITVTLTVILVIYNIFYVSVAQRIKYFGLLRAMGATKKQIRKVVFKEGILLSLVGIPIGVIIGYALSYEIIPLLLVYNLKVKSSPYIVMLTIIVSLVTIVISLRKPGKMASKISAIEAMKYSGAEISTNKKERNSNKKVSIQQIAYLNLWRNKKRTIMTVLSLTMSGILFIVVLTILNSMSMDNFFKQDLKYDFSLFVRDSNKEGALDKKTIESIKKISGVKNVYTEQYYEGVRDGSTVDFNSLLFAYDNNILNSLKKHLVAGKTSFEGQDEVIIINNNKKEACNYKVGDKIEINFQKQGKEAINNETIKKEFTVVGILNKNFSAYGGNTRYDFIVKDDVFTKITGYKEAKDVYVDIDQRKYEGIKNELKKITDNNNNLGDYQPYTEFIKEAKQQLSGMEAAGISIVGIIGVIGILNFVNTMITSIFARKKEFGMLQAVGLSNSQLKKMIQIEGLYYAVTSAFLAITCGTALGYKCFALIKSRAENIEYKLPLIGIILLALIFVLVEIIVSILAQNNIKKEPIIERIRYNE